MFKTLTAGLTALSLILVPAAPAYADSRQDEINRTILSLLAVGAISLAIKNHNDTKPSSAAAAPQPQPEPPVTARPVHKNGHGNAFGRMNRQPDLLPGRCFRRVETGRGTHQSVYSARCLTRNYRDAHTLPRQCAVRMGGADGSRVGYEARCLGDFGYRSDRRWN